MHYKKVISDAWHLAKEDRRLFWAWAFIPAVLSMIVGIVYFVYQVIAFSTSPIMKADSQSEGGSFLGELFKWVINLFETNTSMGIVLIVVVAVIGLFYLVYPTFCRAALIQLIARIRNGQDVKMVDGITYGALGFLKLFEYHLLVKTFSFVAIITEAMFVLRNLGWEALKVLTIPFILFGLFGFAVMLFLTYTDFYIVIDEKGVMKSIGQSMRLVVRQWRHTLLILILMLIISLRIILNIVLVLLVPSLIFLAAGVMATLTLAKIGMIIGAIVGVITLLFASYLTGILEVFANAVWVFTFLELTEAGEVHAREKGMDVRDKLEAVPDSEENPV